MITNRDVVATLAQLGADQNAVADSLKALGIRGKRGSASSCPIAAYLNAHVADRLPGQRFSVTRSNIMLYDADECATTLVSVEVPEPVYDFIADFDHCVYPELVLLE